MDALIAQIKAFANTADDSGCQKLQDALRDIQYSLEAPWDTAMRLAGSHLQVAGARIGVDLGLFNALAGSESPLTVTTLAEKSSAAPELLGNIASCFVFQVHADMFTKAESAVPGLCWHAERDREAFTISLTLLAPAFQELPDFLAETKYQDITDNTKTPFQKAFHTELPLFAWLPNQPERFAHFQKIMKLVHEGDWLSVFPVENEVDSWSAEPNKTLSVDVGGSIGHQCIRLKARYPQLRGRVTLQDLPQTLERVKPIEGVEVMVQNFWEPQAVKGTVFNFTRNPVICAYAWLLPFVLSVNLRIMLAPTGAKFYYMRRILHDYPDERCVAILQNLILALDQESRILIDEMVLPNTGVHWQAAQTDLTMMTELGSKERTRDQWNALLESAGLKITDIHAYNPSLQNSIIVVVPK